MTEQSVLQLVLALLGVLVVLAVVLIVYLVRMPAVLKRLRPPQPERPRRVLDDPGKASSGKGRGELPPAEIAALREQARAEAEQIRLDAERLRVEAREVLAVQTEALDRQKATLFQREESVAAREAAVAAARRDAEALGADLESRRTDVETRERRLAGAEARTLAELERVAGISAVEARTELLGRVERDARLAAASLARDIEEAARREADRRARRLVVDTLQRVASEQTVESVVSTVPLPSDDMKGRIIGREGRNIRAFEQVTGVNLVVDDTPEMVLLSCFDPVRRETARLTLTELVADGRIHPGRIEEVFGRNVARMREICIRAAEEALLEVGITDLDPELLPIVGALKFRTSYGQNVLAHLIECAHLAGIMAAELGLDVDLCKRCAFLHDIGKALTHEHEGTHAAVGADLARRHGEHPDVVHAIEAHHNEVEPRTVEAVLTQAADAISGSRPGARRESLEAYVTRLERIEQIAGQHEGVDRVYAMQAGREVRVMVAPDKVSDAESQTIAREIARQIESELTYPGQIRITVVRESRAIELAH